jgi:hypothetical protein
MSVTKPDETNPLDDEFIDRIVDGKLTPADLRAAIDRLDREPDGWKRCALAYLEAQCWRESFRAMGDPARSPIECPPLSMPDAARFRPGIRSRWLRGSIAAGVAAVSFALGWLGHAARPWSTAQPTAIADRSRSASPAPTQVESSPLIRSTAMEPSEDRPPQTHRELARAVMQLRFDSETTKAEVPILAGPGIDAEWVKNQPPPVSERGQVVLQQHGYQVDQRRRLITTTLDDGRRVTVPIDQVQIRYTGSNPL